MEGKSGRSLGGEGRAKHREGSVENSAINNTQKNKFPRINKSK